MEILKYLQDLKEEEMTLPYIKYEGDTLTKEIFDKMISSLGIPSHLLNIEPAIPRSYSRGRRGGQ
jgi:hypothetical protein